MSGEERHYCILTEPHSFSNISCGHLWSVSDSVKPVWFQPVSILDSIIVGYGFVANAHNASRHIVARRPLMCCPFQTHWNSQISQFLVSDQRKSVIVFKWAIYTTTYIIKPHLIVFTCTCVCTLMNIIAVHLADPRRLTEELHPEHQNDMCFK